MRDPHVVEVINYDRVATTYELKEAFEFRKDLKHHWLQKLCIKVLKKLGAYCLKENISYVRHVIDVDNMAKRVWVSRRAVIEHLARDPGTLLIGSADYAELMGSPEMRSMMAFSGSFAVDGRNGPTLCGMKVVVVPWMSGMLPVPDSLIRNL